MRIHKQGACFFIVNTEQVIKSFLVFFFFWLPSKARFIFNRMLSDFLKYIFIYLLFFFLNFLFFWVKVSILFLLLHFKGQTSFAYIQKQKKKTVVVVLVFPFHVNPGTR